MLPATALPAATEGAARTMLLPVGMKPDVMRMMSLVLPDPGVDGSGTRLHCRAGWSGPGAGRDACPDRRRVRHHTPPRTVAGSAGLAPQRIPRHRHGPADPIRPLVAHAGGGSASADAVHGPAPGAVGPALRSGRSCPPHHRRPGFSPGVPSRCRRRPWNCSTNRRPAPGKPGNGKPASSGWRRWPRRPRRLQLRRLQPTVLEPAETEPADNPHIPHRHTPDTHFTATGGPPTMARPGRLGVGIIGAGKVGAVLGAALCARPSTPSSGFPLCPRRAANAPKTCCPAFRSWRSRTLWSARSWCCWPFRTMPSVSWCGARQARSLAARPTGGPHVGPVRRRNPQPGPRGGCDSAGPAPGHDVHGHEPGPDPAAWTAPSG